MVKDIWLAAILSVHFLSAAVMFFLYLVLFRAAASLRQLFGLRLVFSFASSFSYFCRSLLFVRIFRSRVSPFCSHDVSLSLSFSPVRLLICDSFLDYGYFSLSFVKEREQRKSSGEAFPLPGSCPSPGSVKPHPGIGYPMPLYGT